MKIVVMGTGGLGGYFGGTLARGGQDVTFIARSESLEAMRKNGLQVFSPRGDFAVNPVQATDNPGEAGTADLVLFCVKSYDVDKALETIKPVIGQATVVIPVLNGIEHITTMRAQLGDTHVLGGLAWISAHKGAPGVVHHVVNPGQYQIEFGEWPAGVSPRCEQIQEALNLAGLKTAVVPNVAELMWGKLAGISGGMVLAVMRGELGKVWTAEAKAMLHKAVNETAAVAAAGGISLSATLADDIVALSNRLPPEFKPSLLVDLERGRRLEVEAISGFVSRLGKQRNVPTPVNDFVYACLKPYANGSL